jgi:prepilin peptidase CpaA
MIELALMTLFPLAVLFAAISDLYSMTISNRISLVLIAGFAVLSLAIGMDFETIGWNVALAGLVLVIGFTLFAFGWVGGGDVKLMSVVTLWLGFGHTLEFMMITALLGGLLTIMLLVTRQFALPVQLMQFNWISRLHSRNEGVPYGVAMGPAALMVYSDTPFMHYAYSHASWLV